MSKDRSTVPAHLTWRAEDLFETVEGWEAAYAACEAALDFSAFEGKLTDAETLLACMRQLDDAMLYLNRVGVYAQLLYDTDSRNSEYAALQGRFSLLAMKISEATAFITPELTALPTETLEAFAADPRLSDYDYTLRCLIKEKPHILSREMEELLAQGERVFDGYQDVFGMLDNADFPAPTVTVDGEEVKVSHGMYGVLLRHPDREVRRAVFDAYYKTYIDRINTITAIYSGNVDKDVFLARARKYGSCLELALASEDVDVKVYENLLASVNESLPLLHRYFADRKAVQGYDELHMYDLLTPLVEGAEMELDYEDAFKLVKEGLSPLGERYGELLQEAHDNRWIDVEETDGKRNGAYSMSVFGVPHPFVLLNYQPTTGDIFTIAHELGHALHSYHSQLAQPQEKAGYKIFVAEVASTVNEVLLVKYLLKKTEDVKLKKYLLSYFMDTVKATLFRQTQFAEFEFWAHDTVEKGQPLTKDALCEAYYALNRKYYGDAVVSDDAIAYEWARVPHFYRAFYVYKYATGIVSAISIAERIYAEGAPAVEDYFRFLSSGGSDSPVELLKLAGVDLTKPDAFRAAMASFEKALEEFEALE